MSTDETRDRQPDPEDIDLDELAGLSRLEMIDILESLSKPKLIALITESLDSDETRTDAATNDSTSASAEDTTTGAASATQSSAAQTSQSDDPSTDDAAATPTPDGATGNATWEMETDYQRPPALDLSPGSTVLVQCGSQDDRKSAARHDLLGLSESDPRNVLLVQYRAMSAAELESIADAAKRVKIISIGCSQSIPPSVEETIESVEINNPNDVTRLGILATSTLDDWAPLAEQTVVSLNPLDVMLQYKTGEATFRFLHIFLGKLSSRGAISHFFVNPSSSDPQTVNTLKPLFDDVLTIDSVGVDVE
ncbi:MAG: hypothetical protein J07HN6_01443 [Halonotius sp. J07HN6]|nr:MAG: hypothetical protein J07HN6_01443 [Halonotius sp. J07HN6]ERH05323.1 MAG: hypothetical protein J07HN4v3_00918 [Halonotius sp. J07HN4]